MTLAQKKAKKMGQPVAVQKEPKQWNLKEIFNLRNAAIVAATVVLASLMIRKFLPLLKNSGLKVS